MQWNMPWLIEYLNENQEIKSDVINQLRTECKDENDKPCIILWFLTNRIFTLYNDSFMWTTIQNYQVQQIERLIFYWN